MCVCVYSYLLEVKIVSLAYSNLSFLNYVFKDSRKIYYSNLIF